jgi:hypothetical protein
VPARRTGPVRIPGHDLSVIRMFPYPGRERVEALNTKDTDFNDAIPMRCNG